MMMVLNPLVQSQLPVWIRGLQEESSSSDSNAYADLTSTELATLISCLVLLIIGISVAFELMKHSLVHHTREGLMPVVEAMFAELTTLGFLSLLTYLLEEYDVFDSISESLFGNGVVSTCFELCHMGIFFVAFVFTLEVVLFLRVGASLEDHWTDSNASAQDPVALAREEAALDLRPGLFDFQTRKRKRHAERLFEFASFREEFLLSRQVHPPFAAADPADRLPKDFDYARYLLTCYAETMAEVVEKPVSTWTCLMGLLLVFYIIMLLTECELGALMWVWLVVDWGLVAALQLQGYLLSSIKSNMINPIHMPKKDYSMYFGNLGASMKGPGSEALNEADKPRWTSRPPPPQPSIFRRWTRAHAFNRQHDLFLMGGKGPEAHLFVLRLLSFLQAIVISVYFIVFADYVATQPLGVAVIYTLLFWVAPFIFVGQSIVVVGTMVHVTSHGVFTKPKVVSEVIRYQKTGRAMFALLMISKIRTNMDQQEPNSPRYKGATGDPLTLVGREVVHEVEQAFGVFDKDRSGSVDVSELGNLLVSLGLPMNENELKTVMAMLDSDDSGVISLEEFVWWFAQTLSHHQHKSPAQVVTDLFDYIDADKSGSITLSEFASTIQTLNSGLSMDEVSDLFRDIDKDHSGSVDKDEFKAMLLQYLGSDLL